MRVATVQFEILIKTFQTETNLLPIAEYKVFFAELLLLDLHFEF